MGDPKFARKHYTTPSHPWDGARISEENMIIHKYGLKNKRELWKTQTLLRDLRRQARELQARLRTSDDQAIKESNALLERLIRLGLLSGKADLNDVLALEVEALLARRLQTQIYLKGLARTVKQARQLIVHGHIGIAGRKVTVPSYMVTNAETPLIDYYLSSPMVSDMHPERPAADFSPQMTTVKEERRVAEEKERDMRRSRELERIAAMRKAITGEPDEAEDNVDEDKDITELTPEDVEGEKAKEPSEGTGSPKGEEKGPKGPQDSKAPPKDEATKKGGDS
jgi:small subunit ribosomal protein S4